MYYSLTLLLKYPNAPLNLLPLCCIILCCMLSASRSCCCAEMQTSMFKSLHSRFADPELDARKLQLDKKRAAVSKLSQAANRVGPAQQELAADLTR